MHVDDSLLVRLLDGETDQTERRDLENHLDACAPCMERLDALRGDAELVHEALRVWDEGVTRRRGRLPTWFRAAASIVLLFGVAGAVQPVRAWIVDGAQAIWSVLAGDAPIAQSPTPDGRAGQSPAVVSFVPRDVVFTLEVAARQSGGTLLIETVDRSTAEAEIFDGAGGEDLLVLPAGLRIVNDPSSRARYVVRLPRSLAMVRVTVAGESTLALEPAGVTSRWEIDLAPLNESTGVDTVREQTSPKK